ncbi:NAD(P)/FAD-dependent oxidoreductase [[Haemophilus] ducreyi]|uniref:NAD(P)/FAD-dependent oxidoreductase n=1 Tax=Haemophilus ducreyi TaxID=730 RepID=UPI000655AA1D|nr:NAD(P)/FAD-dependent oxidoreductase [[Haemophilus] ducreyi]AKO45286.1 NADH dehydrogenase [[Haemophilus] ducreyi]AKO46688.1 NADH dehydrogenase [[Haemophilus] ducreyi]AKO48029.1 NADH dehydrogenase [[Haemophilus] ducreyi]AKO49416.1 NADH dehydrogenase [[Haemophilus] ducreyi]ANF61545.1 NADH dehydrogenase [[Haemophilus] ducreyi]
MAKETIIIVGGGAGGLELATYLGNKLSRKNKAHVLLIDRNTTHLWKPLLHEVATGSLDEGIDALSYRAHAKNHGFEFQQGTLIAVDRKQKQITLAPIYNEQNELLVKERQVAYDKLVIAIGSKSNDFGTKGVAEHCIFLDDIKQAKLFQKRMMELFLQFSHSDNQDVKIAIVGGGATGIELSAELYNTAKHLHEYGFGKLHRASLKVTLVEASERLIPALTQKVSNLALYELRKAGVDVKLNTMITEAVENGLITQTGEKIEANLIVWSAGVKASDFVKNLGFATNHLNQIEVKETLQTTVDDAVYVIGDCASLIQDGKPIPPRAQAAHQMATQCGNNIIADLTGKELKPFKFNDRGSLLSFSHFGTVGTLMGNLVSGNMFIEGKIARLAYLSLYRMHQVALHGWFKTGLILLVGQINRLLRPSMKLH